MVNWVKRVVLYFMFGIVSTLLIPGIGKAEIYFGAMGGYSFPNDFSDVTSSGDTPGFPFPDAGLGNSVMGGGKVGFYMDEYNWFGFETEGFFTEPDFLPFVSQGVDAKLRVITWGLNALIRYPGKRFQPYLGAGVGLFFAEIDTDLPGPSLSDDWVPGVNVLAGVRGFVTDSMALFAEYKFNYAKLNLESTIFDFTQGFEGNYSTNIIAGGLSFHFN
jgi:opacity protein-like surface antigen